MRTVDAVAEILKREGVEYLPCFPTTPVIEACAAAGIRPIVCRQERVGVGIADGYSRITNGRKPGVFACQYGPGAENAYSGVATAFSDSVPMLVLPMGNTHSFAGVEPHFNSRDSYGSVTKRVEEINSPDRVSEVMRRAFSSLRMGRPGPVMVEIPADVGLAEVDESALGYRQVKTALSSADPRDIDQVARVLLDARAPIVHAGQGVMYAEACEELLELAELLQIPVMTTLAGKSAFPERHALAVGAGSGVMSGPLYHFLRNSDVVFGIGTSFTKHGMCTNIPPGKVMIQATADETDINKSYDIDYPVVGDAKLVLRQLIDAVRDRLNGQSRTGNGVAEEIAGVKEQWLGEWMPKLTSNDAPINPYRVLWEFMHIVDPNEAIVTHDSGGPRNQIVPFYEAGGPRTYIGWGKSHGLGTGLGLNIGAKLAAPEKMCVNFMGDAAFGMTGLDFETAVRCRIPIVCVVLNNSTMAVETGAMRTSHELYNTRDLGGDYADLGRAMGGYAERITDPAEIGPAFQRARRVTEQEGQAVLLEFITTDEHTYSLSRAL